MHVLVKIGFCRVLLGGILGKSHLPFFCGPFIFSNTHGKMIAKRVLNADFLLGGLSVYKRDFAVVG